jgi:cytosine/adenosine deaminase-related metal-dependent hydrolase
VKISSGAEFAAHDARLYSRFHLFALRMALPRSAEMNTQAFDIAIRHARLRGSADRYADIGIKDGRVAAIARRLDWGAATEIDARGNLATESFVNPHLHRARSGRCR